MARDDGYGWCSTFAHVHIDVLSFSMISCWRILCIQEALDVLIPGHPSVGWQLDSPSEFWLGFLWWLLVPSMLTAPRCLVGRRFSRLIFLVLLCNLSFIGSPGVFNGTSTMLTNGSTSVIISTCALFLSALISPLPLPTTSALLPLWILFFTPLTLP